MKFLILFLVIAAVAALEINPEFPFRHGIPPADPPSRMARSPVWRTITQRLDNFDPTNPNLWNMRYIENGQFFENGGPIFIMLGAEWTIDVGWVQNGQMFDIARINKGFMFYTEHRYFGSSYPTNDLSTPNLKYLTVDQALADIANFIVQIKRNNPAFVNSKVVVFGGSYGATLATWMRQKYPQLVHAAVASSAPLNAKINFWEYHDVVKTALGPACASVLQNASKQIRAYISSGNLAKVEQDFTTCNNIKDDYDVQSLFQSLSSTIGGKIQYGNDAVIKQICSKLQDPSYGSAYEAAVAYYRDGYCKATYQNTLTWYTNTALNSGNSRQWFYQTCSNFGWFQTAWDANSLYYYGDSADLSIRQCRDVFGANIANLLPSNVNATNMEHGALNVGSTRIISVHGSIDPWHSIGVLQNINADSPTYVVPGYAHCADMYSLSSSDSADMIKAKLAVINSVGKWLQEPY